MIKEQRHGKLTNASGVTVEIFKNVAEEITSIISYIYE